MKITAVNTDWGSSASLPAFTGMLLAAVSMLANRKKNYFSRFFLLRHSIAKSIYTSESNYLMEVL